MSNLLDDLRRLEALREKCSHDPWIQPLGKPDDTAFIVAARNTTALADAIAEIERLRAEVDRLRNKKCVHQLAKEYLESAGAEQQ